MSTIKVLVPDMDVEEVAADVAGPNLSFDVRGVQHVSAISAEDWGDCDAVLMRNRIVLDRSTIGKLSRCRIIVRAGVGYDNIDIGACSEAGIPVCNVPNYGTSEIADHAIGLLLYLARGLGSYDERLRTDLTGNFNGENVPVVRRLRGGIFGAVGLGRIGTAVARRASALDMSVLYFDPLLPEGHELGMGFRRAKSLSEVLSVSDVVSLHMPLNDTTLRLLDANRLGEMKPGAILINIARGKLVDIDAVYDALLSGRLGAAGFDVLPSEPPDPSQPLFKAWLDREPWIAGRLALTPHAASYSDASTSDRRRLSAGMLKDFFEHGLVRNNVNPDWEKFSKENLLAS
ncbi:MULTISPECIES: C-terminal binding protein [unclassified Mesorhizobium]|uniref:C-terminal binding protein n=1 Tax=unclassified Mesorhizobium TaxID=325217 RepID=UPI0010935C9D|nr:MULTISPECIES: C-terminal binding protein [unclassified Mesorhizobium]TGQ77281.1 C-terminal binding protein [Mesorhizobium sp. M8A.F.Ca.ET.207.01.1.1]TGS39035.1 C-terminal binding protein [Mesorhizobium sp. M8A.F.Ca.ET.182.01.1.1]TGS77316.1 C-terminal binding protein [Mesorhizobium sp. M8A.F.Ca.ET.181.01.1.1]TGT36302.1 C-terminal binding protein [Mesorhizobium sp. M8A.F.Ca.ET.165.01.1.1]